MEVDGVGMVACRMEVVGVGMRAWPTVPMPPGIPRSWEWLYVPFPTSGRGILDAAGYSPQEGENESASSESPGPHNRFSEQSVCKYLMLLMISAVSSGACSIHHCVEYVLTTRLPYPLATTPVDVEDHSIFGKDPSDANY